MAKHKQLKQIKKTPLEAVGFIGCGATDKNLSTKNYKDKLTRYLKAEKSFIITMKIFFKISIVLILITIIVLCTFEHYYYTKNNFINNKNITFKIDPDHIPIESILSVENHYTSNYNETRIVKFDVPLKYATYLCINGSAYKIIINSVNKKASLMPLLPTLNHTEDFVTRQCT